MGQSTKKDMRMRQLGHTKERELKWKKGFLT